jgi:hypothetical protein
MLRLDVLSATAPLLQDAAVTGVDQEWVGLLGEITDKGYLNQRAILARRAALVERLYSDKPGEDVVIA